MSSDSVDAVRYEAGALNDCHESLTIERPLQIRINGKPFSITMVTPGDDLYLVRGLLFAEGVARFSDGSECRLSEDIDPETGVLQAVDASIPEIYLCDDVFTKRSLLANSSCGMCGQREFDETALDSPPLTPTAPLELGRVAAMIDAMRARQEIFEATGSTHAAAVFDAHYEMICLFEDIGRHNAVDKAIGFLLEKDALHRARVLTVSGRVSFEIVIKAFRAGIPYLLAVSGPSSFAIEIGQRFGMSILGFCREGRATIYSNPKNVKV
jgi:FdhD protein